MAQNHPTAPPNERGVGYVFTRCSDKLHSAGGLDNVHVWMLLWAATSTVPVFMALAQLVWAWGVVPLYWRIALQTYVPKPSCKNMSAIAEHRPIALRVILAKLMAQVLLLRVSVTTSLMVPKWQMGFTAGMDSRAAFWAVGQLILEKRETKSEVWLLLCDWAKAYDTVWRAMVMLILHAWGARGKLWLLIADYIADPTYIIEFKDIFTSAVMLPCGLGQGCPLSAELFKVFMAPLNGDTPPNMDEYPWGSTVLKLYALGLPAEHGITTTMFTPAGTRVPAAIVADDTTLMSNTLKGLQSLMDALMTWGYSFRFTFNAKKFQLYAEIWLKGSRIATNPVGAQYAVRVGEKLVTPQPSAVLLGMAITGMGKEAKQLALKHLRKYVLGAQIKLKKVVTQLGMQAANACNWIRGSSHPSPSYWGCGCKPLEHGGFR